MRRIYIGFLCLFFVLVLSCALVEAKELYSDWHYSGDTFIVDGEVFLVTHYGFYDSRVVLEIDGQGHLISNGTCDLTPVKEYCIAEIFNDLAGAVEGDPIKFEEGEAYAGILIKVNSRGPTVALSRDFSTTTPELDEEVVVTVTIENTGEESAYDLIYKELFPEKVFFTSSSSITERTAHSLVYNLKFLSSGTIKTFTYKFKVRDYLEFNSKPVANYTFSNIYTDVNVPGYNVKVARPYDYTLTLSATSVEATDQTALSVKIKNDVSDEITVDELWISIPDAIAIQTKPGELVLRNGDYYWDGTINSDKYELINFVLRPTKSGDYKILTSINVTDDNDKKFFETKNITITSNIQKLEPILSIIDKSVAEGSDFRVAFSVKNPNEKVGYNNIKAKVVSELFPDMEAELETLLPGKATTLIVDDYLTAPFLDQAEKYSIEALGTYETSTGEKFEFSSIDTISVTPVDEVISIAQNADKMKVNSTENVTITVKIRNNNEESIKVDVYDVYSEEAVLVGGKTSGSVNFDESATEQVYTYKLKTPLIYNESIEIFITTTASIKDKNYMDNETLVITVFPVVPVVEEEEEEELNITPPETVPRTDKEEEEEPGFFEKVLDAITDFFRKLFKLDKKE